LSANGVSGGANDQDDRMDKSDRAVADTNVNEASGAADGEYCLPNGWEKRESKKSGKVYYIHKLTQKTQWYRPPSAECHPN
jgi:hypothetical protein